MAHTPPSRAVVLESLEHRRLLSAALPEVKLFAVESTTTEGGGPLKFDIVRDAAANQSVPLTVKYALAGTAVAGIDYVTTPGTVVIPAGARSAQVILTPIDDSLVRGKRTVQITITSDPAYQIGPVSTIQAVARIIDNDLGVSGADIITPLSATQFGAPGSGASRSLISVTGMPFTQANRITVTTVPAADYFQQLQTKLTGNMNAGDNGVISFWVRDVSGTVNNPSQVGVVLELSSSPYTKSVNERYTVRGTGWTKIQIPFTAKIAHTASGASASNLHFNLGYQTQVFDIGGVSVVNYGTQVPFDALPQSGQTYRGRGVTDLDWRDAAEERIDTLRKRDASFSVIDANGQPVANASVRVALDQNRFGFGTAVSGGRLLNLAEPNRTKYQNIIKSYFDKVVLENDLKWGNFQGNPSLAINSIAWLNANGIDQIRGHTLIWPGWRNMPASPGTTYGGINYTSNPSKPDSQEEYEAHIAVDGLAAANAWLKARILNHITSEASNPGIKGKIADWDVINEPYGNDDIGNLFGDSIYTDWVNAAVAADPNANIYINDNPLVTGSPNLDYNISVIQNLRAAGARVDGFGMQFHLDNSTPDINKVQDTFTRLKSLGIKLQITEFDSENTDPQVQADVLRDYMTLAFADSNTDTFMNWGFWAGSHYAPIAALWNLDWTIRPNGQVWVDHISDIWSTDFTASSSAGGTVASSRVFTGDYNIDVTVAGKTYKFTKAIDADGNVQLQLSDAIVPTVVTPAAASPSPVTGTTTALSVLGGDNGGEANLKYTWSTTGTPPATVNFSANGTNAAKNTTATFTKPGTYSFLVTIQDAGGLSKTSSVNVTVNVTLTSIVVTPSSAAVNLNGTRQFSATARDQFGIALASQPTFTWAKASGVGSINATGLYTAPATAGSATVTASSDAITSAAASVTVADLAAPTLSTAVSSKQHGGNGIYNLNLALGGTTKTIEPRSNGANKLIFSFSEPIKAVDNTLSANEFTLTNATFSSATISGSTLTLNLSGVVNRKYATITLNGLSDLSGNTLTGVATLTVGNLYGDANQSGSVNVTDQQIVKNALLKTVTSANFLLDVNASGGTISVVDQQAVKNNLLSVLS